MKDKIVLSLDKRSCSSSHISIFDILFGMLVAAVTALIADLGLDYLPFETLRTEARQSYLFGFGRSYDDGRGQVTKAHSALYSWHGFGAGCDIVEKSAHPWDAPKTFWNALGEAAEANGLAWGGRWSHPDLPHVQMANCPVTPTQEDRDLFNEQGMRAVWGKYGWL